MSLWFGKWERWFSLSVLLGLFFRLVLVAQPLTFLLEHLFVDDTFYYFSLIRNFADGLGVVFNVGVPTNGFHPFMAFFLTPVFLLVPGDIAPIYISLVLIAVVNVLTAVFIFVLLRREFSSTAGFVGGSLWLLNPFVVFPSLMGLETAFQAFFIAWLVFEFLRLRDLLRWSFVQMAKVGVLIALVFLSRMDGLFLGVGVLFVLAVMRFRQRGRFVFEPLVVASVAFIVVLPWLLFSVFEVGHLFPVSAQALRVLHNSIPIGRQVVTAVLTAGLFVLDYFLLVPVVGGLHGMFSDPLAGGGVLLRLLLLVILLVVPLVVLCRRRDAWWLGLRRFDFLFVGAVLYYAYYFFVQLGLRGEWYSLFTSFLVTILLSVALVRVLSLVRRPRLLAAVVFSLITVLFVIGGLVRLDMGSSTQEVVKYDLAQYVDRSLPADAVVASFNTGVYQYFSRQDVLNLDGVMNPEAFVALKRGRTSEFMREKGVRFLVDSPEALGRLDSSILCWEEVNSFDREVKNVFQSGLVHYVVYRISYAPC